MLLKMDDLPVNTTPNHHPHKMDVLPKTFLQIILAANWLVRHSIPSPKQKRRPLPSLLAVSSSMAVTHKSIKVNHNPLKVTHKPSQSDLQRLTSLSKLLTSLSE